MAIEMMHTKWAVYTRNDKQLLFDLAKPFEFIIDNKCTNAVVTQQKDEAWDKVAELYNSYQEKCNGTLRAARSLRICYNNSKQYYRKHHSFKMVYIQLLHK